MLPLGPTCLVLELVIGDNSLSASGATLQRNMQQLSNWQRCVRDHIIALLPRHTVH